MASEPEWVSLTGTDSDPMIGDSEIVAVRFRGEGGLTFDMSSLFLTGEKTSEIVFKGVRFLQISNESVHYLDGVRRFDSIADALKEPDIAHYLSPVPYGEPWFKALCNDTTLRVYRFLPIAGAETFVVCQEALMRPWKDKK